MKTRLLTLLLVLVCVVAARGQTARSIAYNASNAQVIAATNLVWTNSFSFSTNTVAAQVRSNLSLGLSALTNTNVTNFRSDIGLGWSALTNTNASTSLLGFTTNGQVVAATNVTWTNSFNFSTNTVAAQVRTNAGLGASWLTNTNVTNFRTAVGLGEINDVTFETVNVNELRWEGSLVFEPETGTFYKNINFNNPTNAAITRTNLGLGLPALTNTSNVTTMRALSGSTNTNTPFSGSVSLTNTNTLVFSNGILQSTQ